MVMKADRTTDGWRGRAGSTWSERDILAAALAFGTEVARNGTVAIGFDGRAGSRDMALLAARILAGQGIPTLISAEVTVTPAVGRFVAQHGDIGGGLIFTASHNPPGDVGLKVRGSDGLPLMRSLAGGDLDVSVGLGEIAAVGPEPDGRINAHYLAVVGRRFEDAVSAFEGEVVLDAMHGAAGGLSQGDSAVRWRRAVVGPFFFGIVPDPVLRERAEPEMIAALAECADPASALVLMTDGDGDRLCLYTACSGYVSSSELAVALIHDGLPVQRVISTHVAESVLAEEAAARKLPYDSADVGFKNIVQCWKMSGRPPALGVEPNGGIAVAYRPGDYFERDALATAELALTRFPSAAGLDDAVHGVRARRAFEAGQYPQRTTPERLSAHLRLAWPGFGESRHEGILRFSWPPGWRVLIRRSGTESLTRCYVEGPAELHEWFSGLASEAEITDEPGEVTAR
jgi:phosphomannomutase